MTFRCNCFLVEKKMDTDEKLLRHEIAMSLRKTHSLKTVVEELRLLADSMSTHKALAEKIGISPQYLHDILSGHRAPGIKVLVFLKLEAITVYRDVVKE